MPQPRNNFGISRATTSVDGRFDNPFRSPYSPLTFPNYAVMSSSYSSPHHLPYQQKKRPPYGPSSVPNYRTNSHTSVHYSPNWRSSPRAHSPYIYKSPQHMVQEYGGSYATARDCRRDGHMNSGAVFPAEQFDVNDYVVPSMTSNPWAKLEEFYDNRRLDGQ
uniref:Uncharacterized protein n=1 Tax=Setaria digitata TaxID=48799 RepID=A0A915PFF2_9BILA